MLLLNKRILAVKVKKKKTTDKIAKMMKLTMYKKNQQENKNSTISIFL